jgi:5-methylthioadenosine/S-adenosylhomocysteine deaminase
LGSIESGKSADLCAVNLDSLETAPCYDPASHLVYAAGRENVSDVWVAGRHVVGSGSLLLMDEQRIRHKAAEWKSRILGTP